jgi:hypothetical protein
MASENGNGPRHPACTAERATRALPPSARSRWAWGTGSAHITTFLLHHSISRRRAHFHAHRAPLRPRRVRILAAAPAAAHGTRVASARNANTHANPLRSAQRAAPRIAAASRVLSTLRRDPTLTKFRSPPCGFLSHTGGAGISGLGASAPDPRGGRPKKAGTQKVAKIEAQKKHAKKNSISACENRVHARRGGGGVSGGSGAGPARGEPAARRAGVVASRRRPASALRDPPWEG